MKFIKFSIIKEFDQPIVISQTSIHILKLKNKSNNLAIEIIDKKVLGNIPHLLLRSQESLKERVVDRDESGNLLEKYILFSNLPPEEYTLSATDELNVQLYLWEEQN